MLQFTCPRCSASLEASPIDAGTRQECTACGKTIKVPGIPAGLSTQTSIDDDLSLWPEDNKPADSTRDKSKSSPPEHPAAAKNPTGEKQPWPQGLDDNTSLPVSPESPHPKTARETSSDLVLGDDSLPTASLPEIESKQATMLTPGHVIMQPPSATSPSDADELKLRPKTQRPEKQRRYITVVCGVCETRLHATEDKVGQTLTCPDCGNKEKVPAAPPKKKTKPAKKRPPKSEPSESNPFDLSEMVESWSSDIHHTQDKAATENQSGSMPFDIPKAKPKYVSMHCPLCETLLTYTEDRLGKEEQCPDCYTMLIVKSNKSVRRLGKLGPGMVPPLEDDGEELQLREGVDQPSQEPKLAIDKRFRIPCPVCDTHLFATPDKIGKKAICPDCKTSFLIEPPRPKAKPKQTQITLDDGGIRVGKEVVRTGVVPANSDLIGKEALQKAHQELEEEERERPKLPPAPLITGVFSYPWRGHSVACWITVSLWLMGCLTFGVLMVQFLGEGLMVFMSVILAIPTGVLGMIWIVYGSICGMTITQESGNGLDDVDDWPGWNVLEWGSDALYVIVALSLSAAPGGMLGVAMRPLGIISYFIPIVTIAILFPILLLSMLAEGSIGGIASPVMWRRLSKSPQNLLLFYILSPILIILGAAALIGAFSLGCLAVVPAALFCTALGMIYFRMLGRLGWAAMEAESEAEFKAQRTTKPLEF